jgi:Fic family protein
MSDRQTVSEEPLLIHDPEERAAAEAENALLQFDRVLDLIDMAVRDGQPFRLRPSTILALHAEAMKGVHRQAGTWRNTPVEIQGSKHQPPAEHLVVVSIEDMCDWVNGNWSDRSAVELCAYIMWRLNWIHPFADGNGRTARAVAYLVLCVRAGARLPGAPTIPEQIAEDKRPYYDALEAADQSENPVEPDLSRMIDLLEEYLGKQLQAVLASATQPGGGEAENTRKFH